MPSKNKDILRRLRREHYYRRRSHYIERSRERNERIKAKLRPLILEALAKGCVDCGENDPVVLDFDHRNHDDKHLTISRLIANAVTPKRLLAEIAKCDVRCSNCHRRRHAKENSWWRLGV